MASSFDVLGFASKILPVIEGISKIIGKVKGASKSDKVQAVVDSLPDSLALAEYAAGHDLLNDADVAAAIKTLVEAEHAVLEARDAVKQVFVRKAK